MEAPSAPDPLPPWAAGLPEAAAALRTLLLRIDGTSGSIWTGTGLEAALFRYQHVFLPMYAAHLAATGVISLAGAPAAAADALVAAATDAARSTLHTALRTVAERGRRLSAEERAPWTALSPESGGVAVVPPIPPLDVAFVWALARLDTAAYEADCVATYGVALPVGASETLASASATAHGWVGNATTAPVVTARLQWVVFATAAQVLETPPAVLPGCLGALCVHFRHRRLLRRLHREYLPAYLWPPLAGTDVVTGLRGMTGDGSGVPFKAEPRLRWAPRPRVAALQAVAESQRLFTGHLVAPGWDDPAAVVTATARYVRYLELAAGPRGRDTFLVPTPDMDLVWHAHLASTAAYARDTTAVVGHALAHTVDDDATPGRRLATGRAATAAAWAAAYPDHPDRKSVV